MSAENYPSIPLLNLLGVIMKSKLRIVEVRKDKVIELPDGAIPVRLEHITEPTGLVNPRASLDKFVLYYLEKER